jgi:hypothetical protein
MKLQLARPDESYEYNIVAAQESSVGAAVAVIALDGKGLFVASMVRSGRWSGKGAFNGLGKGTCQEPGTPPESLKQH